MYMIQKDKAQGENHHVSKKQFHPSAAMLAEMDMEVEVEMKIARDKLKIARDKLEATETARAAVVVSARVAFIYFVSIGIAYTMGWST